VTFAERTMGTEKIFAAVALLISTLLFREYTVILSLCEGGNERQGRHLAESRNVTNVEHERTPSHSCGESDDDDDGLLVQPGDYIYTIGDWDSSPIVMEKYKLVFFTSAKVGCTVWKQLFRRMMGIHNWTEENTVDLVPWNPETNGLQYLHHYDRRTASNIMTDPTWTRAMFIRDPKERLLSAYLDKGVAHSSFIQQKCCPYLRTDCVAKAASSLTSFFEVMQTCSNAHWYPQSNRMEAKYWPYLNFVGRMETIAKDAERLLRKIGAWEGYGAWGWGENGTSPVFGQPPGAVGRMHATNAAERLKTYFTPELEQQVEYYYRKDYRSPYFNFSQSRIFEEAESHAQVQ
jgi:Sulfotransferase family